MFQTNRRRRLSMENSYLCCTSGSESKSSEPGPDNITSLGDHIRINEFSTDVTNKVEINDRNTIHNTDNVQERTVERYQVEDEDEEEDEDEDEDDFSEEALLAQMGYASFEPKRALVKDSEKTYHEDEEEKEEEEDEDLSEDSFLAQMGYLKGEPPKHEPITAPTAALNLVSALKGSREKEGKPAKECRVSWAPDVYDPPPTSAEHPALSKTERHKAENKVKGAAGKNRQKGGGKVAGAIDEGGGGGKGSKSGGSKGTVGGGRGGEEAGKGKDKKKIDRKQVKKRGSGVSKYSDFSEY